MFPVQSPLTSRTTSYQGPHEADTSTRSEQLIYLPGFKHPVTSAIIIHLVPPAQANHEPPCDILGENRTHELCVFCQTNLLPRLTAWAAAFHSAPLPHIWESKIHSNPIFSEIQHKGQICGDSDNKACAASKGSLINVLHLTFKRNRVHRDVRVYSITLCNPPQCLRVFWGIVLWERHKPMTF